MSKIKILKVSSFYPKVFDILYNTHTYLKDQSYHEQYQMSMDTMFGWADFWKKNLDKTEKYELTEILCNNKYLQLSWAKENNIKYSEENWDQDIVKAQIELYQPDILFAHDYYFFDKNNFLKTLKDNNKCIKFIIGFDGLLMKDLVFFEPYDLIMTPIKEGSDFYNKNKKISYAFNFGFEKSILDKIKQSKIPKYNVSFAGSIINAPGYHVKRFNTLGYVAGKTKLNLWASSFPTKKEKKSWQPFRYPQRKILLQKKWKEWKYIWRLGSINEGSLFGKDMYEVLANSKITINNHIDKARNLAGNIRLYEATGTGTCLLTDWKENIHQFFKIDEEIVTYKTPEECCEKIKYLLNNENERIKIANAGQKVTLKRYSFEKRVNDFIIFLEKFI